MDKRRIGLGIGMAALLAGAGGMPARAQAQAPAPAPAQTVPGDEGDDGAGPDIVVNGNRLPAGSVVGDIPPEQVLNQADIRSYGVSSLNDLLAELAPETRSDRGSGGAPVVLLNGRRISSFAEIRDIPTEAIARVDILPEEVALKYGYRADQRVVNIVLRQRFRAITLEGSGGAVTDGGRATEKGELDTLTIGKGARFNLDLDYQHADRILESDRNLVSRSTGAVVPGTGITDLRPYRTLSPATQTFSANAVYAKPIGKVSASLNARIQLDTTDAEQGLPDIRYSVPAASPFAPGGTATTIDRYVDGANPLGTQTQTLAAHFGLGLNGDISPKWRWTVTANYDRTEANTFTDTGLDPSLLQARLTAGDPNVDPFKPIDPGLLGAFPGSRGYSTQNVAGADALINGQPFKLPGGNVSIAARVGAQSNGFDSRSTRFGIDPATGLIGGGTEQSASLSRNIFNGQLNVDLPLTSRRTKFFDAIGDLSINGNIAADHLSDFGTLWTYGYGFNWSPAPSLRIITSLTDQAQAPTQQQLGNPIIATPNVRVFDYVTGETVDVTQVSGGNRGLAASERHVFKVGATLKPVATKDWTLIANFIKTGTDNPVESFPAVTAAVAAAFPGRFTRDGSGTLTQIDSRPVNFAREDTQELRYGINVSFSIKSKLQKEFEAFRAGKGANPLAGLR
ncbi:MAG: TonB-dependent receptor, partial [Pseudomonadota bacterium]|nr:TonB-dependent receptor [Pseudomonadota bacterium]